MPDLEELLRATLAARAELLAQQADGYAADTRLTSATGAVTPARAVAERVARLKRARARRAIGGSALLVAASLAIGVVLTERSGQLTVPQPGEATTALVTAAAPGPPSTEANAPVTSGAAHTDRPGTRPDRLVETAVREHLHAHPEEVQLSPRPSGGTLACGVVLVARSADQRYGYVDTYCASYRYEGIAAPQELAHASLPMRVELGPGSRDEPGPVLLALQQPRLGAGFVADLQALIPEAVRAQIGPKSSELARQMSRDEGLARRPLTVPTAPAGAAEASTAAYLASLDPEVRAVLTWMHADPSWRQQAMVTSRDGDVGCGVRIYGRSPAGDVLYVGALCSELKAVPGGLVRGSGSALPARLHVRGAGADLVVQSADIPQDWNYVTAVTEWFPPDIAQQIFAGVGSAQLEAAATDDARARLGLPNAPIIAS